MTTLRTGYEAYEGYDLGLLGLNEDFVEMIVIMNM
jgi:hypothetical protein